MELPLYRIVIDMEDPVLGMSAVSLVEYPAIEVPFLCFDAEKELFKADDERHIITGPAILADTPIYRRSQRLGEYQIIFEKDTIRQLVEKYSANGLLNSVNLQHNSNSFVECAIMVESMIIDKERGVCPNEFTNLPDGSWIVSYKITDDNLWNEIKTSGQLNGFSIEIISELELVKKFNKNNIDIEMNKLFKLAKMLLKLAEINTDKGLIYTDGEIAVGKPVLVETEDGPIEAADGEYVAEDGTIIVVEAGVIIEIKPVETPVEEEPVEAAEETPVEEEPVEETPNAEIEELKNKIAELEATIVEKDNKIAELEAKIAEQEEKLKMSVEEPITKKTRTINVDNKALKYFK